MSIPSPTYFFFEDIHPSKITVRLNKRYDNPKPYEDFGFKYISDIGAIAFHTNGKERFLINDGPIYIYNKIYDCGKSVLVKTI